MNSGSQSIESLVGLVLDGLLCFIRDHLRPNAKNDEIAILDTTKELIQEELNRIDLLVQAIWDRITPELETGDPVVSCPDCHQLALVVDDPLRCRFCERVWKPEEAAAEYASEILDVTWHDIAMGDDPACRHCPYCSLETLVGPSPTRCDPHGAYWICFNCHENPPYLQLSGCPKCGELMDEETGTVCQSCLDWVVNSD